MGEYKAGFHTPWQPDIYPFPCFRVAGLRCRDQQRSFALVALPTAHVVAGVAVWQPHLAKDRMLKAESLVVLLLKGGSRFDKAVLHFAMCFQLLSHFHPSLAFMK